MKDHSICKDSHCYRRSNYIWMFLWNRTSGNIGGDISEKTV